MNDFKNLLILSYFFQYKECYLLSKLQEVLGLTNIQLENRITDLMNNNLLSYQDNLLSLTSKGAQIVLSKNIESFPFEINAINATNLTKSSEALTINGFYIPKKFIKKYKELNR
jgi:predicted transcriptional regulator